MAYKMPVSPVEVRAVFRAPEGAPLDEMQIVFTFRSHGEVVPTVAQVRDMADEYLRKAILGQDGYSVTWEGLTEL